MDLATTSLDAYVLFSAPRERDASHRPTSDGQPPAPLGPKSNLGWWVGAFYGLLVGALMLGLTASGEPLNVARISLAALTTVVATQAILLKRSQAIPLPSWVAQGLTTPAIALAIAGLGGLARLSA
jgi:hypothetical protein